MRTSEKQPSNEFSYRLSIAICMFFFSSGCTVYGVSDRFHITINNFRKSTFDSEKNIGIAFTPIREDQDVTGACSFPEKLLCNFIVITAVRRKKDRSWAQSIRNNEKNATNKEALPSIHKNSRKGWSDAKLSSLYLAKAQKACPHLTNLI